MFNLQWRGRGFVGPRRFYLTAIVFFASLLIKTDFIWGAHKLQTLAVDFDDTLMFTNSQVFLFNKDTQEEIPLTTQEFAEVRNELGPEGIFRHFSINEDENAGTYRNFRDHPGRNMILEAVQSTLEHKPFSEWKGPAWDSVVHALNDDSTYKRVAIVTARGHNPQHFVKAFEYLVNQGYFRHAPLEENIFSVSSPLWRKKGMTTERAKVEALSLLLDNLEKEVQWRRAEGQDIRGELLFIDDDRKNFEIATQLLPSLMPQWRNTDAIVSFVGAHYPDLRPQSVKILALPKDHSLCLNKISQMKIHK